MAGTGYEPLNTPKPMAEDLWLIDGPAIQYGRVPYSTRATVVRLSGGDLWVHSPTELTKSLQAELEALGPVRHLVVPNAGHVTHIAAWQAAFPGTTTWVAPGVDIERAGQKLQMAEAETPWAGQLDQLVVRAGPKRYEAVFFHRASRTLVLADLFEAHETKNLPTAVRPIIWLSGTDDSGGHMRPKHRWALREKDKAALAEDVETMIRWDPRRLIIAHGRCFKTNAVAELERAFRKALRPYRWETAYRQHQEKNQSRRGKKGDDDPIT